MATFRFKPHFLHDGDNPLRLLHTVEFRLMYRQTLSNNLLHRHARIE